MRIDERDLARFQLGGEPVVLGVRVRTARPRVFEPDRV